MGRGYACVGLYNPKYPANVGSTLRAAGCYGVNSVFYSGERYDRVHRFRTDTQMAHKHLPLIHTEDFKAVLPKSCTPVAIEITDRAKPLFNYAHPDQALYLFGPEDGSLSEELLRWCRDVIYIPTKYCMNLAATVNVVLYDRLSKRR